MFSIDRQIHHAPDTFTSNIPQGKYFPPPLVFLWSPHMQSQHLSRLLHPPAGMGQCQGSTSMDWAFQGVVVLPCIDKRKCLSIYLPSFLTAFQKNLQQHIKLYCADGLSLCWFWRKHVKTSTRLICLLLRALTYTYSHQLTSRRPSSWLLHLA